jgi:hypothetical protein
MLAENPPNLAGARELLAAAPDASVASTLAELKRQYGLP